MSRPIAADKKEKIIKLAVNDQVSTADIAERLGCRRTSVAKVLRDSNCKWNAKTRTWSIGEDQ